MCFLGHWITALHFSTLSPECRIYFCTQLSVPKRERCGRDEEGGEGELRELAVNQGLKRELGGLGWQVFLKGT